MPVDALLAYASRERADAVTFRGASLPVAVATRERLLADRPAVAFFASSDDASAELAAGAGRRGHAGDRQLVHLPAERKACRWSCPR